MKFFFPDSQDQVDPSFDFVTEERSSARMRHRDDEYAHEVFKRAPFDGVLVSKAVLDSGRYSLAQKHRMLRSGVRDFFRITDPALQTMGDCGAFAYVRDDKPPFSVAEVVEFYQTMGFDYGMSVDHIILGYEATDMAIPADWIERQALTLKLAEDFLARHSAMGAKFTPIGVAQGWSPKSYSHSVTKLQELGYKYVALGGMVGLKTADILKCLREIKPVLTTGVSMHLLGITRIESVLEFADYGVTSIDSTSPLRQAFKDMRDNYYADERTYTAIRVPQVEANPHLVRLIKSGKVDQAEAQRLERACLEVVNAFDKKMSTVSETVDLLVEYEGLYEDRRTFGDIYRETLEARPWDRCSCEVCRALGIHVMLFRGAERNRRRGFHNLFVFYNKLQGKKASRQAMSESLVTSETR
jgi:hypothetical protein